MQSYSLAVNNEYIFAGTEMDGVARSSDRGSSWKYVNNGLPNEDLYN